MVTEAHTATSADAATSVISDGTAGSPPVAFGFGCSAMALQ
jgi:hypothetical protein